MSDTVKSWIEERRGIHAAATAGPWESGYWYHVQGESHCMCGEDQGPLVGIDPHGSFGRMHVHRRPEPIWEEGIRTRDDSTGGSDVVVDTDEYGGTSAEDRAAIVDAHNMLPRTLNALEQVLRLLDEREPPDPCVGPDITKCVDCLQAQEMRRAIEGAINEH